MTDDAKQEDFDDFFETARTGFIITDPDGRIVRANTRVAEWLGLTPSALRGTLFTDHLPIGGKVYYQTHLAPLLRMQGFFEEIALELAPSGGERFPVLANAVERRNETGAVQSVNLTIFKAVNRRQYERNLVDARSAALTDVSELRETAALREQFVAVLGHDLRNPLAAISGGLTLLAKTPLNEKALTVTNMMAKSVGRMTDLIENVMDFARARLGGGISLDRKPTFLEPVIRHAVDELRIGAADRAIEIDLVLPKAVVCDPNRLSQVVSNLVANAITHGASDGPIEIRAAIQADELELTVCNNGEPIPPEALERLFQPFTREDIRPSQQGLGLGLYIASKIALAHGGTLTAQSSVEKTCFTLRVPVR